MPSYEVMDIKFKSKKKYKLRKRPKILVKSIIIFLILINMNCFKFLKQLLNDTGDHYLENLYINRKKSVKNKISMSSFNEVESKKYDDVFKVENKTQAVPLVYLYNTHQGEKYLISPSQTITPSISYASNYLKEKLSKNNIYSIVENRSVEDILVTNGWNYASSYKASRIYIEDISKSYPSIKYFIDIHRDSGSHKASSLCINDICYAKILFLIGTENNNYSINENFSNKISNKVNEKANGLSKGILRKGGRGVNGIYNQDFSGRTILIEVGGENNSIDEVYRTIDILSDAITEVIKEDM